VYASGRRLLVFTSAVGDRHDTVTYYACNAGRLSVGHLRVVVQQARPLVVRALVNHPGYVSVRNRNPARVGFAATGKGRPVFADVPAHSVRHVRVPWHRLEWVGTIGRRGGDAGAGFVSGIHQPS
jgi:hypothetical protein